MKETDAYAHSLFCILVATFVTFSVAAQTNSSSHFPISGSYEPTASNSAAEQLSGYNPPWDTPFNTTGRYPSVVLSSDLLILLNQLQWLLPIINSADNEKPELGKDTEGTGEKENTSGALLGSEDQQAENSGAAEGDEQEPEENTTGPFAVLLEVLYIESILLQRYADAVGITLQRPSVLPDPNECPEDMELTGLSNAELEQKLIQRSSQGNLHATLVRVMHYMSGLLKFDPALAGSLLRRVKSMENPNTGTLIRTFYDERLSAISDCLPYRILKFTTGAFGFTVFVSPSEYLEENEAETLIVAAMTLEAFQTSYYDAMFRDLCRILIIDSVLSGDVDYSQYSRFQPLALAEPRNSLTPKDKHKGWVYYYIGKYRASFQPARPSHEQAIGITRALGLDDLSMASPSGAFYIKAASYHCRIAAIDLIVSLKQMIAKTQESDDRRPLSDLMKSLQSSIRLLFEVFETFDLLLSYLAQIDTSKALDIAWSLQQAERYQEASDIYRGLIQRAVPAAHHRLAWLIHQGRVEGATLKEAEQLYLQAIEAGYQASRNRLIQLYLKNPEDFIFFDGAEVLDLITKQVESYISTQSEEVEHSDQ